MGNAEERIGGGEAEERVEDANASRARLVWQTRSNIASVHTIMLGIENYGSDNDSDVETQPAPSASSEKPLLASNRSAPANKSTIALPPPSNTSSSSAKSSASLSLPSPKSKRPKKITIGLPELPPIDDDKALDSDERPTKKPRIEPGARSSVLLSMLPAPKNKAVAPATQERVLGSGRGPGLVFNTGFSRNTRTVTVEDAEDSVDNPDDTGVTQSTDGIKSDTRASLPFLPPSLVKGRSNISLEEKAERPKAAPTITPAPAVDFFSLSMYLTLSILHFVFDNPTGSSTSTKSSTTPAKPSAAVLTAPSVASSSAPSLPLFPGVSSAPKVDDFVPPEPTPEDLYPGYYLLPSGQWAAYEPEYYRSFYNKWKKEYDDHVRALEKGIKGFEAVETEGAREFNALQEMEKAKREIQEHEERKALTTGDTEAAAPKMNIKVRHP